MLDEKLSCRRDYPKVVRASDVDVANCRLSVRRRPGPGRRMSKPLPQCQGQVAAPIADLL